MRELNKLTKPKEIIINRFFNIFIYFLYGVLKVNDSNGISFTSHPCEKHSECYVPEQRKMYFTSNPLPKTTTDEIIISSQIHFRIKEQSTNTIARITNGQRYVRPLCEAEVSFPLNVLTLTENSK